MDQDELIRMLDRKLKIRAMMEFDASAPPRREAERDFAIVAIDLMSRQPIMAASISLPALARPESGRLSDVVLDARELAVPVDRAQKSPRAATTRGSKVGGGDRI